MGAERLGVQAHGRPVGGLDLGRSDEPQHARGHGVRVVQDGAGFPARDERSGRRVGPVGERLCDAAHSALGRQPQHQRARQAHHREVLVVGGHGVQDGVGLRLVVDDRVVEGAVRLHVGHLHALAEADAVEGGELVEHVGGELVGAGVEKAASEPGQVTVGDVGADGDALLGGQGDGAAHGERVAGVEAAGHVGAADDVEHGGVVAHAPGAERLAEVGVQVDAGHGSALPEGLQARQ